MILTGKEIADLAEYAGFSLKQISETEKEDLEEAEYTIHEGRKMVKNDDESVSLYYHVVTCDGCDGNEVCPIGDAVT